MKVKFYTKIKQITIILYNMINYQLTITSKNPKAIKNFLLFFFQKKFYTVEIKFYKIKNKKKIITTLTSPHVNKKAQSQVEYRLFSVKIKIVSNNTQHLITLKKIKAKLFPEIRLKIKIIVNKQNYFSSQTKSLNPKNYTINKLNQLKLKKINLPNLQTNSEEILTYLKIFDCYGELNLIKNT